METKTNKVNSEARKSVSYRRHQRQRFWQIWLPLIFFILIILGVAVLMVLTVTGVNTGINVSQYGDVSLIWILLPLILLAVIIAAVLFGFVFLNTKILKNLPKYAYPVQKTVFQVSEKVKSISKKIEEPIISIKSVSAGVNTVFSSIAGLFKK